MLKKIVATFARLSAAACLLAASPWAAAQAQPPLKIVVGTPAGGSMDVLARLVAEQMKTSLQRPVVVENRTGAAGRIAAEHVKQAAPDGNTLWVTASANVTSQPIAYQNLRYDPFRDFVPVSQLAGFQLALAVPAESPARDVAGYLRAARADPKQALFASPAAGSLLHFVGVMLGQETGAALTHVPFQGTAQLLPALVGHQVPAAFLVLADTIKFHEAGRLRVLATSGAERSRQLPQVPTFREQGFNVVASSWFAAFAPAGTPQATVDRVSAAMAAAVREPGVRQKLIDLGLDPIGSSSAELAAAHRQEYEKLGPVIRASGFKGEQ